jgi:hypothetical protein
LIEETPLCANWVVLVRTQGWSNAHAPDVGRSARPGDTGTLVGDYKVLLFGETVSGLGSDVTHSLQHARRSRRDGG